MFFISVHSGLDPGSWGCVESCRDHQRLQRRTNGPSLETGRWNGILFDPSAVMAVVAWMCFKMDRVKLSVMLSSCCLRFWSTPWVQTATLFPSYGTRTSWLEKMTSLLLATCTNLLSCTTSKSASSSRTTSTHTVVSKAHYCLMIVCVVNLVYLFFFS